MDQGCAGKGKAAEAPRGAARGAASPGAPELSMTDVRAEGWRNSREGSRWEMATASGQPHQGWVPPGLGPTSPTLPQQPQFTSALPMRGLQRPPTPTQPRSPPPEPAQSCWDVTRRLPSPALHHIQALQWPGYRPKTPEPARGSQSTRVTSLSVFTVELMPKSS